MLDQQVEAYEYLTNPKHDDVMVVLYGGGAGGGKSYLGCDWIIEMCCTHAGSRWFLGRKELKRLKRTTWRTFQEVCEKYGLQKDIHYKTNWDTNTVHFWNGSQVDLLDLKFKPIDDPDFERFGSYEFTGGFIEEAGEAKRKCLDALLSRLRFKHEEFGIAPKILMTCNPTDNFLYFDFYKPFEQGTLSPEYRFVPALAKDNTYLPRDYWKKTLGNIKDQRTRNRMQMGLWSFDDDDTRLFTTDNIADLFTNPVERGGEKFVSGDLSRKGKDRTTLHLWEAWVRTKALIIEGEILTNELVEIIDKFLEEYGIMRSHCVLDEGGMGGGVIDFLPGVKGFLGGAAPFQPTRYEQDYAEKQRIFYKNLRAQCLDLISSKAKRGEILIIPHDSDERERIEEQAKLIKWTHKDGDKLQIIDKATIKEALGYSPDDMDSIMMRAYFDVQEFEEEPSIL